MSEDRNSVAWARPAEARATSSAMRFRVFTGVSSGRERGCLLERAQAHECAALVDDGRVVAVQRGLGRFAPGAEGFGTVLRPVADVAGLRVVPPGGGVVGHAEDDAVAGHRGGQAG